MKLAPVLKAEKAVRLLEEAVLEVLLEAWNRGQPAMTAIDIARQSGIYRKRRRPALRNAITSGILAKLSEAKRIQQVHERGPWRLADAEAARLLTEKKK